MANIGENTLFSTLCQTNLSFHLFTVISDTNLYSRVYFILSFFLLGALCLWLSPAFIASGGGRHFSTVTKDDSTSRAHKPPGPCAFAFYGPQGSEQTSVLLWKQPLISERRLAVKLMKKGIITNTESESVRSVFLLLISHASAS